MNAEARRFDFFLIGVDPRSFAARNFLNDADNLLTSLLSQCICLRRFTNKMRSGSSVSPSDSSRPLNKEFLDEKKRAFSNNGLDGGGCDRSVEFDRGCRRRSG